MEVMKNTCYTYFKITGDFDPNEITRLLGLKPSSSWEKGDLRRSGGRFDFALWEIGRCNDYDVFVENQMRKTIAPLLNKIEVLQYIHKTYDVHFVLEVVPSIFVGNQSPCLAPPLDVIDFCHETRTEIDIDMYVMNEYKESKMLSVLENKRFHCAGRTACMLCLYLGDAYSYTAKRRDADVRIDVSEYVLHIQSPWRFRVGRETLLAYLDLFEPYDNNVPPDWQCDLFGRPDELCSVFDVKIKSLNARLEGAVVDYVHLSPSNDLTIEFSNGIVFEQFVTTSNDSEAWRMMEMPKDVHWVCDSTDGDIIS